MVLSWLHLLNFKNWEEYEITCQPGINCIVGPNGKGKTNILDAIYYLSFTKSFLPISDSQNIKLGEGYFMIEGDLLEDDTKHHIQISFKKGQKKQVRKNKKEYQKITEHIGVFPTVLVCPQYGSIVTGGSEERRRWMDALISQFNGGYLLDLLNYQKVLQQRNALIKQMNDNRQWSEETLLTYDVQLDKYGKEINKARSLFIEEFISDLIDVYQMLSKGVEEVKLTYQSKLNDGAPLTELLIESRNKDKSLQYTTVGTHRDDLVFEINSLGLKKFGSQGQQKTFLMALKLAEHKYLSQKLGKSPVLMLDDIFDKLDQSRVRQLIKFIAEPGFGQVFITDTGSSKLQSIFQDLGIEAAFYDI